MIGKILNVTSDNRWITFSVLSEGEIFNRSFPLDPSGYKYLLADLTALFGKAKAQRLLESEEDIADECKGLRVECSTRETSKGIKIEQFLGVV